MTQLIVTHTTRSQNRLAIGRWGLIPRDTTKHNYPNATSNGGVEAVYVRVDGSRWLHGSTYDVWHADIAGLPSEPDPLIANALRILTRIDPERLTRVGVAL